LFFFRPCHVSFYLSIYSISILALQQYLDLEGTAESDSDDDNFGLNVEQDEYFKKSRQKAYSGVILMLLDQIHSFSTEQFTIHQHWIVSMLTKLLCCDNQLVRKKISVVFTKFVLPKFCS
jgi:hypothetical protein